MAELIVVTGGSYCGKTAVIDAIAERGHEIIHEAAYEVIAELTEEHGVELQARWRRENQVAFQREVTLRQHRREVAARVSDAPFVFCDRGLLDGIAYCRLDGVEWPEDLEALVTEARYAHVFLLETLSSFDLRLQTGRYHTLDDSHRVAEMLHELYAPRAAAVTHVPERPVPERVAFVLRTLGLGGETT
ncbi:MAG: AAA family ATPase [Planctomycetota bacterium]